MNSFSRRMVGFFLLFLVAPSFAGDRPPAAAIASAHLLATEAGFAILNAGGNAFDAAVAVSAALAVVEPYTRALAAVGSGCCTWRTRTAR